MIGTTDPDPMAYFGSSSDPAHNALWYPLLLAADTFEAAHGRYPGASINLAVPAPLTPEQARLPLAQPPPRVYSHPSGWHRAHVV